MKNFLRGLVLATLLTFGACSVAGCASFGGTGQTALIASEQGTTIGYDTLDVFVTTADNLCVAKTLAADKCVEVKGLIHKAKAILDGTYTAEKAGEATDPATQAALLAQLVAQIKAILGV